MLERGVVQITGDRPSWAGADFQAAKAALVSSGFRALVKALIRADNARIHGNIELCSSSDREVSNMAQLNQRDPVILRRRQVEARTGLSRSTLYQYIKNGAFPRSVPLGPRAVGWVESEVSEWIATRISIRRGDATQSR